VELPILPGADPEAAFVEETVMVGAELDEVVEGGLPAPRPVADVVPLQEAAVLTTGEAAASVPRGERPTHRSWDGAPPSPDREWPLRPVQHGHEGAVAAHPSCGLHRDPGPGLDVAGSAASLLAGQGCRIDVDDDLARLCGAPRLRSLSEERLRNRGERVGPPRTGLPRRFRGTASVESLGRLKRLDEGRADLRRELPRDLQAAVLVPAVREVAALVSVERFLSRDAAPVGANDPVELGCRRVPGKLDQLLLRLRAGDPGQRPHLGVGELATCEAAPQMRQLNQHASNPHVLTRRARIDRALPSDPGAAGVKAPALMGVPAVELGDQEQPAAGGGGDLPGHLDDQVLKLLGPEIIEHMFECRPPSGRKQPAGSGTNRAASMCMPNAHEHVHYTWR
jgi:hypothetical protein